MFLPTRERTHEDGRLPMTKAWDSAAKGAVRQAFVARRAQYRPACVLVTAEFAKRSTGLSHNTQVSPGRTTMKVVFEKRGRVAHVTINRPERLNACDFETYTRLTEIWTEFRDDPDLRVAIFTGAGDRAFCAGSDIKSNYVEKIGVEGARTPYAVMLELTKPIIAAINGHANGGGLEQALACDIRVAAEHAQFGLGEVRLGWLPGGGGTQRLPRLIPLGRALEMLYTGKRIDAREALKLGLADYVVPLPQLIGK